MTRLMLIWSHHRIWYLLYNSKKYSHVIHVCHITHTDTHTNIIILLHIISSIKIINEKKNRQIKSDQIKSKEHIIKSNQSKSNAIYYNDDDDKHYHIKSILRWNIIQNDTVEKYHIIWDVVEHNMIQVTRWCNVRLNIKRCTQTNTKMMSLLKSYHKKIVISE